MLRQQPVEYASFGLSEEDARETFGSERVQVFHAAWDTTETSLVDAFCDKEGIGGTSQHRVEEIEGEKVYPQECYAKAVCSTNEDGELVVAGLHLAGPMAGEVIQGFAAAHRAHRKPRHAKGEEGGVEFWEWFGGMPKSALDDCIGIHPTLAEGLVQGALSSSKTLGESPEKTSC